MNDNTKDIEVDGITLKENERQRCEVWTRVMGYFRPTSNYNIGKKQEFEDRKYFTESAINSHK